MARTPLPPAPSPLAPAKREPSAAADTSAAATTTPTPRPGPHKKRRVDHLPAIPIPPFLTPQTIRSDSSAGERSGTACLALTPAPSSVKLEPDADADADFDADAADDGDEGAGAKAARTREPYHHGRPTPAEPSTVWANRRRLGRLLHELARAHRWREAAGVFSTLLAGCRRPESFEETRNMFVVAMEVHKQLAEDSGLKQGSRSRYYLRTQKLYDVWMRKLIWLPKSARKHLVKLELALFYLSQGNIEFAYNATKALICMEGLQTEPTLNLIHGLISYDQWYSGLPKDMQLKEFDVYSETCAISMATNGCDEIGRRDTSYDDCSIDVACSSESSINIGNIDNKRNIFKKSAFVHHLEETNSLGSQVKEEMVDTDFQSVFFNTSDSPDCGLEKSLMPLRLKRADGASNDCFDLYWKYKSAPSIFYEDAVKCLRVALHSTPPVMAALMPLIQILLLGDKLKDALIELEKTCHSSPLALPFRLRGRLLEYFDQNQVSTISACYEEALRRDPTCSYSMDRLTKLHRKGYYNIIQLLEAIALHLDSVSGKPWIWEELVSCFHQLFSVSTTDHGDCISCNVQSDAAFTAFSIFSSVFSEQHTRETWKVRCRWWMNHHFNQPTYTKETLAGDRTLLASKAACASHLFGPEFPYVKAVLSYLSEQEAKDEIGFLSRNMQSSVRLQQTLEKLTS